MPLTRSLEDMCPASTVIGGMCVVQTRHDSLNVGDKVIADARDPLHCGSGCYTHAYVIQVEPLILVSEESDMRWSCVSDKPLCRIGKATKRQLRKCMKRLEK